MDAHRKGSDYRREVARWFEELGLRVESRGLGYPGDDITVRGPGIDLSVEAKNHRAIDLARFIDQTDSQAGEGQLPVCFIKRRGRASVGDSYVVMSAHTFGRWLRP